MKKETFSTIVFCVVLISIFNVSKINGLNIDKKSNSRHNNEIEKSDEPVSDLSFDFNFDCKSGSKNRIENSFNKMSVYVLSNVFNEKISKFDQFINTSQFFDGQEIFHQISFYYLYDCKDEAFKNYNLGNYENEDNELYEIRIIENGKILYSSQIKPKTKEILKRIKSLSDVNFSSKNLNKEFLRFLKEENSKESKDNLNNEVESFNKIKFTDHIPSLTFFLNMETYKKVSNNNKALKLILSFFLIIATSILTFLIVKSSVDWANNSKTELNKYYELRNQKIVDKLCQNKNYFKRIL